MNFHYMGVLYCGFGLCLMCSLHGGFMAQQGKAIKEGSASHKRDLSLMSSPSASNPLLEREAPSSYHPYPPPLASYQDVAPNPKLFMDTLQNLHAIMGTKFMIPIIGGKELDLHQLFVEVTRRGGVEQVIRKKKWKEIKAFFNFPSTATNASFVLRKNYLSLLLHYEKIYFFRAQGWSTTSAVPMKTPSPTPFPAQHLIEPVDLSPRANLSSSMDRPVAGVIDGKFDHGYLVSVTVGTKKLRGILYNATEPPTEQNDDSLQIIENVSSSGEIESEKKNNLEMETSPLGT